MRKRTLAVAALAATLAAGCGQADEDGNRRPGSAAEVVRVTCGDEGARVLTPLVEAQPDGLHVQVTNETAREVHFTLERDSRGGAGGAAPPGTSGHVFAVGPGEWAVTCYVEGGDSAGMPRFELVDTGIWVSTEIDDCEIPESSHGDPPMRVADDRNELPELARRGLEAFTGLEPGYDLEPAGYPQQEAAIFRARRDDRTIATISFYEDDAGGWFEGEATACADPLTGDSGEVEG
jgi:hypothetical protein